MMARGHLLSGVLAGVLTVPVTPWASSPLGSGLWVLACSYGGWVPDLDMPGAKLSKVLGPVTYILALGIRALSIVVYELTRTEKDQPDSDGHRTLTHTLVFPPAFGLAVYGLMVSLRSPHDVASIVASGLVVGSWAHIAGDCCTIYGCPLWWPFVIDGRRWYYAGIPRVLRFRAGTDHDDKPWLNWWEAAGERVVTFLLYIAVVLASFALVPGGYSWVFGTVGDLAGWSTSWMGA